MVKWLTPVQIMPNLVGNLKTHFNEKYKSSSVIANIYNSI